MASCRFLTLNNNRFVLSFLTILIASSILISCGTTKEAPRNTGDDEPETTETTEGDEGLSEELVVQISSNRSNLDDVYATQKNEIPGIFKQESEGRDIGNPNEGYRVQVLSTRNVNYADSVANDFRFWADENFKKYKPKVYVLFRQPYYKVHIGNFQFHDQAMKLNQYLKDKYPDAWVVHDEVEPNLVPPESVTYDEEK